MVKSYLKISALKSGAQKLGRISDRLEIPSLCINSEMWCMDVYEFPGEKDAQCL